MTGFQAALWGLLGSGVAEALTLSASMHPSGPRRRWRWPWGNRADRPAMLVAIALRLFAGCGLAAALGASGYLNTEMSALTAGVATPLIVAKLFQLVPLHGVQPDIPDFAPPSRHEGDAPSVNGRSNAPR